MLDSMRTRLSASVMALAACLSVPLLRAASVTDEIAQIRTEAAAKRWANVRDRHLQLLTSRLEELTPEQATACFKTLVYSCEKVEPTDVPSMMKGLDALLLKPEIKPSRSLGDALNSVVWSSWKAGAHDQSGQVIQKVLAYTEGKPIGRPGMYVVGANLLIKQGKAAEAADLCYRVARMEAPIGGLSTWTCPQLVKALIAGAKADGNWERAATGWACAMYLWEANDGKYNGKGDSPIFALFHSGILPNIKEKKVAEQVAQLVAAHIPGVIRTPVKSHEMQKAVAMAYAQVGEKEQAIAAIKTLYQACPANRFDATVTEIASMLKKMDGSIARANRFLDYVKFGTVGPDGKPGTEDDTVSPFPETTAQLSPDVSAAYQEAIQGEWENTWQDKRCLSVLYRYMDEPAEALKRLDEAFALAPMEPEPLQLVAGDMTNVLIQLTGNPGDGDLLAQYLKYGKEGRDGKLGSDDDLTDPRAPFLK